ncbi:MAG: NAD-dependent epimerase/dehydratase family protein [Austwickia sp.]|nr:NAD-dependent epimerase/dehydratase family protein [Austwickia sp.]
MGRTILVTGVSRHLGARVARGLALHREVTRVIGLDVITPAEELGRAEFVRADIRNPVVARLLNQARVDTVVHLALSVAHARGRARTSQKEDNVIGTMQLFAACQQASHLERIVLKSTGSVYGSSPRDPAMFTEEQTAPRNRAQGSIRDALEVESYLRSTRRRRPDLAYSTLRLANVVGPHMSSPLLDYLSLPLVPIPLGYDARLQLLHEDDAVAAMIAAVTGPAVGVVNVAAQGVLKLSQAVALAGRPFVLIPTYTGLSVDRALRLGNLPRFGKADLDYLRFGRVLDTSRARELLDFRPRFTTREAFLSAAAAFPPPVPAVSAVRGWAGAVTAALLPGRTSSAVLPAAPEEAGPDPEPSYDVLTLDEPDAQQPAAEAVPNVLTLDEPDPGSVGRSEAQTVRPTPTPTPTHPPRRRRARHLSSADEEVR